MPKVTKLIIEKTTDTSNSFHATWNFDDTITITSSSSGDVNEGDWVTIKATAFEGFRFRQWSDGNTEAERKVKVTEDVKYTAFFEKICNVEEEWPVVVLYDWLIMIHYISISHPENI